MHYLFILLQAGHDMQIQRTYSIDTISISGSCGAHLYKNYTYKVTL